MNNLSPPSIYFIKLKGVLFFMKENIINLKNKLMEFFNVGQVIVRHRPVAKEEDFFEQVRQARLDWQIALNNYNFCEDPDFIDYSIYNIQCKEKRFIYLIKRARKENVRLNLNINENSCLKSFDN
jgi:hypothetical protein